MEAATELSGTIDHIVFKSEESGFLVFILKLNARETITVRGTLGNLHQGTEITVRGTWSFHPKFGRQLEAHECITTLPSSTLGIQKYLASGLIKGIGPKFAEKLVSAFGEKTLEVIDKDPQRLMRINGVGPKRVESIVTAWQDQKEISRVMVFLRGKDVSPAYATKIFKAYGNQSVEKIQENPYRLVDDIWGIGFKTADQIALKLGLERHAQDRIKAGILYAITHATEGGHLYVEVPELKEIALEILELSGTENYPELLKSALTSLYQEDKVKLISHNDKHYLSLPQFYYSERGIAQKILRLLHHTSITKKFDIDAVYRNIRVADERGIELNEDQQRGILSCLQNKATIITGGPGTGKTTLVKRLIHTLETNHVRFKLAAPTGRAAKRLFESTGKNTETLHRLLEFTPGAMTFARNENNALELDYLIVDEASMIDVFLMHAIMKALPWHATLVLIGDIDQLPSVGAGNVLKDMIDSEKVATVRLTQIFRQAQNSLIIVNAHRVNRGEFPQSYVPGSKKDFVYLKEDTPENIFPVLRKLYEQQLPQANIAPADSIVLVPMNRGIVGTQRLNQELQMILNPTENPAKQASQFGTIYKVSDRVMQIRNNYDKFVFNGDIGTITDINTVDHELTVTFGDRNLTYDFTELNELTLSYAVSIHKSQGSEFACVIIPIFMQHFILLQRNLIYTAITRAKKLCILIGQSKAIAMGIRNDKGTKRLTFLKEFLTTDLEARS
ncbi:MAG: ATP-dependent RecD-like DNA helicase [Candidatus Babeliales bacterium]|jgi:exodeoxyribonuclease V alpha subunit